MEKVKNNHMITSGPQYLLHLLSTRRSGLNWGMFNVRFPSLRSYLVRAQLPWQPNMSPLCPFSLYRLFLIVPPNKSTHMADLKIAFFFSFWVGYVMIGSSAWHSQTEGPPSLGATATASAVTTTSRSSNPRVAGNFNKYPTNSPS
jgi:hypothetical protein